MDACEASAVFGVCVLSFLAALVSALEFLVAALGAAWSVMPWLIALLIASTVFLLSRQRMRSLSRS